MSRPDAEVVVDRSLGFWAKCRSCSHCWIAAYYPAPVSLVAKLAGKAVCPKCGNKKPVIAKQDSGVLQEASAAGIGGAG